jgi:hypothetical protein
MIWVMLHPRMTPEHLGHLPGFLSEADGRTAAEQFNDRYQFGGWRPLNGFKLKEDNSLEYPGDQPLKPLAHVRLRDELVVLYRHDWVAVIQPDRSFEVCRMD